MSISPGYCVLEYLRVKTRTRTKETGQKWEGKKAPLFCHIEKVHTQPIDTVGIRVGTKVEKVSPDPKWSGLSPLIIPKTDWSQQSISHQF